MVVNIDVTAKHLRIPKGIRVLLSVDVWRLPTNVHSLIACLAQFMEYDLLTIGLHRSAWVLFWAILVTLIDFFEVAGE